MQSWSQRIESLVETGEWLEALALALNHYESSVSAEALRRRRAAPAAGGGLEEQGGGLGAGGAVVGGGGGGGGAPDEISDLLLRYLKLAVDNAPRISSFGGGGGCGGGGGGGIDLVQSHFQMLAGVCVEYCAVIGREDVLFGPVFERFAEIRQLGVLLELLEVLVVRPASYV